MLPRFNNSGFERRKSGTAPWLPSVRAPHSIVLQRSYVFMHGVICRVARQIVIAMLRKRFARENKKLSNLVGEIGTTLVAEQPLKVGDK